MFVKRIGFTRLSMLHRADGEGEGGGNNGGDKTYTAAEVQALIEQQTSGLKGKNSELIGKINEFTSKMKPWEGLDPENVRKVLTTFDQNEELKLLAEGKHEEVIHRRIEREEARWKSQLEEVSTRAQTLEEQLQASNDQVRDLMIDTSVVSAFIAEGGLPTAKDDVVLRATIFFDVEEGQVVARDNKGELVRGKDGPITIQEWVASLKESAPHRFPGSRGAGATGDTGGTGDIEAGMAAAASSGYLKTFRKLRDECKNKSGG